MPKSCCICLVAMSLLLVQVLQYLLDDVSEFLSTRCVVEDGEKEVSEEKGCLNTLQAFMDHISERESENFRSRREDNKNSVTLTTIHQVFYFFLPFYLNHDVSSICIGYFQCPNGSQVSHIFLLTMQSKGLEWDMVFIVKVNGYASRIIIC